MAKKNPIKLPLLPDSEPEGDMAEFLAIARAKQDDKVAKTDLSLVAVTPNLINVSELNSGAELFSKTSDDADKELMDAAHGKVEFASIPGQQMDSSMEPVAPLTQPDVGKAGVGLSKILGKPDANEGHIGDQQKHGKPASEKSVSVPGRHRSTRSPAANELSLEQYLQAIPEVFTSSVYGKGEVKLRVTEQMGYLLQLISYRDEALPRPKFVAENLLNELLRDFFVRYAPEIAHLSAEAQRREADRQERRSMGVKHVLSGT